jgi:hypothetical protein
VKQCIVSALMAQKAHHKIYLPLKAQVKLENFEGDLPQPEAGKNSGDWKSRHPTLKLSRRSQIFMWTAICQQTAIFVKFLKTKSYFASESWIKRVPAM